MQWRFDTLSQIWRNFIFIYTMEKIKIIEKIEESAHHFLHGIKVEYEGTREAGAIVRKYIREGGITEEEELILKSQMVDLLKVAGVGVPFVLIPGASILMPVLIKVAARYNIELLPEAFNGKTERPAQAAEL